MEKIQFDPGVSPLDRPHGAVEDRRPEFLAVTSKTPPDEGFRAAFLRSKVQVARTHAALGLSERDRAVAELIERLGPEAAEAIEQPVPGGVGFGCFYTPAFKTGWGQGTGIACDYVCPSPPGGNVNTWLYLTATNRSGLGVEALVAYNAQAAPHFIVFDWARADHWQTDVPFASLGSYLTTKSAHGNSFPALPVWNSTFQIGVGRYRNQVFLYNHPRGGWDLIYQYDYDSSDAQQKTGWVGSWGPIVETFQPAYADTNPLGVLAIQINGADKDRRWTEFSFLSSADSNLRTDNLGFRLSFLDPNYAFIVKS